MHRKEAENQLLTRYWSYLGLVLLVWCVAMGLMVYRLQAIFAPTLPIPITATIPAIDEAKIQLLQGILTNRNTPPSFATTVSQPEPFD